MDRGIPITPAQSGTSPFFEPWMGARYRIGRAALLSGTSSCCDGQWHVMGESHYSQDTGPGLTVQVMEELALPGHRFFDTILSIMTDKPVEELDRDDWSRYAFSNFVQDTLPTAKDRPTPGNWQSGRDAFFAQLAVTRPKQLLVVGQQQWDQLPREGYLPLEVPSPFEGEIEQLGLYAYDVGDTVAFTIATRVYHPSSRGYLDVARARQHVKAVTMVSCNILSELRRHEGHWTFGG